MEHFEVADVAKKFRGYLDDFGAVAKDNQKVLGSVMSELETKVQNYYDHGFLKMAFVGEYDAGKSTIISALTDRRDIKISADIATDETASYDWNGIKLIDTPGLWTERDDHNEITYEAIESSDLLVFCLTHGLFDSVTVENFKALAYGKKYRHKMMLVINKMSEEAGEDDDKVRNYKRSITTALEPHAIDEFPTCFIDALDYVEGIDDNDPELREESRFEEFVGQLNQFVRRKGALARLDVPIRILNEAISDGTSLLARNKGEDNTFFELLNRLSRKLDGERTKLRTRARTISMELAAKVAELGSDLALQVGEAEDFEAKLKQSELRIQKLCEKAAELLEEETNRAIASAQAAVMDVLDSDLALSFASQLEGQSRIEAQAAETKESLDRLKNQMGQITSIAEMVGLKIASSAVKNGTSKGGIFIKAGSAAQSELHKGIYSVGKFVGVKFKPWQAVNLAKNIGNIMKFVGPVLAILTVVIDIMDAKREADNERKLGEARREVNSQFLKVARELEVQFEIQVRRAEKELYEPVEEEVNKARENEEKAMVESSKTIEKMSVIRHGLDELLDTVTAMND